MSLSSPRPLFGIHSVTPYSRTDGTYYGTLKVLEGSSLALSGALVTLEGGSQKFPWQVETGALKAEVSLKCGEYPDFLYTLFLGVAPTSVTTASTTGAVSTLTNKQGTSAMKATTGIASVGITATTGAANLKFGKYVVVVKSATTVDVYASTDVDFSRGSAASYQDDSLKITASALTITTSGGTTVIPNTGCEFIGGSGTIGMTTGDTATFEVLPPSNKTMSVTVGSATSSFPEFGMLAVAQKTGNKQLTELDIYRCKGIGLPLGMAPNAFGKTDVKIDAFYDTALDAVFKERWIEETT